MLDMIRAMKNLKNAILTEKLKRKAERKKIKDIELFEVLDFSRPWPKDFESSLGGFLAFWRSVDAAETIKKVTFKICPPSFSLLEL